MDHSEAVKEMAVERYLLDDLTPQVRDEFEEHLFDCRVCAEDLCTGAAFVDEAKSQLPHLTAVRPAASAPPSAGSVRKRIKWFFWLQPSFAAPAFAMLLGVIAYQNLATIPTLRSSAAEPRILPWVSIHTGTRSAAHTALEADPSHGAVLLLDLPQNSSYTSYAFELYDPQGKRFWSASVPRSDGNTDQDMPLSLLIPGSGLKQGLYTLTISGITAGSERTRIDQRVLDIHLNANGSPQSN